MSNYRDPLNPHQVEADPRRPYKAYASTVLSAIAVFVAVWIVDEDPFTWKEAAGAALAALTSSGIIGGATYAVKNPKTVT